jgi:hypothetical protein
MTNIYFVPGFIYGGLYLEGYPGQNFVWEAGIFWDNAPIPPPPPPGSTQLPTATALALREIEEWFPDAGKRFAVIATAPPPAAIVPFTRPPRQDFVEDKWFPPARRRFATFVVITTDDDIVIGLIW